MKPERTPWRDWLGAAFAWGVAPEAFWRLSLREWSMLTSRPTRSLDRAAFDTLAALYPDKKHD